MITRDGLNPFEILVMILIITMLIGYVGPA
jgi:hypothetical protein